MNRDHSLGRFRLERLATIFVHADAPDVLTLEDVFCAQLTDLTQPHARVLREPHNPITFRSPLYRSKKLLEIVRREVLAIRLILPALYSNARERICSDQSVISSVSEKGLDTRKLLLD